jgi:hypothetical protein
MSLMLIVVIAVAVLLAALLALAATRPASFRIQRTTSIQAPPEKIYPLIHDFHNWGMWSPYEKLDPTMAKTYSGAANGQGAVYEWVGNSKAGTGRMEIIGASPPSKITIKLDFLKPFEGHNVSEFALDPRGGATNVTWSMYGPNSFMAKVMSIFMSMDRLLGKEFENGLANLKAVAEK